MVVFQKEVGDVEQRLMAKNHAELYAAENGPAVMPVVFNLGGGR